MRNSYRWNRIYSILLHQESATVEELAQTFGVTLTTIRRDLLEMESKGLVNRSRGIAYLPKGPESRNYMPNIFMDEKKKIAVVAATYVEQHMSVMLDTGTSTAVLLDYMLEQSRVTNLDIITYSPSIAIHAANTYRVSIPGGGLMPHSDFIVGNDAEEFFSKINADLAFLGSTGVYNCEGLTVSYPLQLGMKKRGSACASKRIALLDSSKYFKRGVYTFCNFRDLDILITVETDDNQAELERISKYGVEIITV